MTSSNSSPLPSSQPQSARVAERAPWVCARRRRPRISMWRKRKASRSLVRTDQLLADECRQLRAGGPTPVGSDLSEASHSKSSPTTEARSSTTRCRRGANRAARPTAPGSSLARAPGHPFHEHHEHCSTKADSLQPTSLILARVATASSERLSRFSTSSSDSLCRERLEGSACAGTGCPTRRRSTNRAARGRAEQRCVPGQSTRCSSRSTASARPSGCPRSRA